MKIVSGGQSGVDRAALDFAISAGVEHGGWCPRGRAAEDGVIPGTYRLKETDSEEPAVRTRQNVIDSAATLIFARSEALEGGTKLTRELAEEVPRPFLVVTEGESPVAAAGRIERFLEQHGVEVLNVAGPRESQAPGLGRFVIAVLCRVSAWTG